MKTKAILSVTLFLAAALCLTGCWNLYREYLVGGEVVNTVGRHVTIVAQLWHYADSGPIDHISWVVDWGDGTRSYTWDGEPIKAGDAYSAKPNTFLQWSHLYAADGDYTISVTCGGSPPKLLPVHIGDD